MKNGWVKFVVATMVTIGLFVAGILVGEIRAAGAMDARVGALEEEMGRGRRWTLEQQLEYMEAQNYMHQVQSIDIAEIKAWMRAICAATEAKCGV
jgi:predicted transcriptional regulator